MEGHTGFTLRTLLLLLAVFSCTFSSKVQFRLGGDVTLMLELPFPEHIKNIVWKFKGDLLAEWVENIIELTYFGSFKNRATLDVTTARLDIRNMRQSDVGQYTVEINGVRQDQSFETEVINVVPQPEIVVRPLVCSSLSNNCTLTCEGDTRGAEPVTYSWKKGDGDWKEMKQVLEIIKAETQDIKHFTCRIKNAVSEKESEAQENPFLMVVPPEPELAWIIVGVIIVLIVVVGVPVCFWKRQAIQDMIANGCPRNGHPAPAPQPVPTPAPQPDNKGPETMTLINRGENNSGNGPNP